MLDPAALITALILDRPMCMACVAARAMVTVEHAILALKDIGSALVLTCETGPCASCGATAPVYAVARPRLD